MYPGTKKKSEPMPLKSVLQSLVETRAVSSVFQPIVSCETGEITGFEALARPVPTSGIADPRLLFDIADHYNMMWPLEEVTRRCAFRAAEDFPNGVLLFTNTTPIVFCDERYVDSLTSLVRSLPGLTPSRIVLEITERGGGDDLDRITEQVGRLKALGFQIAIDDVGAGTSGLNRIMMLRPHWLKLDRELVSQIDSNRFKLNLIRFMVHFARLSGVSVIAEGIERREELETLIDLGVKHVQGFLVGRPLDGYKTIDPALSQLMRSRWAQCQAARMTDPRRVPIVKLADAAEAVQLGAPLHELALLMLQNPSLPGVAVQDGTRLVGWASRAAILTGAGRNQPNLSAGYVCSSDLGSLPPTAAVSEAIEMIAQREDGTLAEPVIVSEHDRVVGIVPLKKLLAASVSETRLSSGVIAGLPGKVEGEKRLRAMVATRAAALDAAFIDVRGFSDFNGSCGYESGDKLIDDLSALLRTHLAGNDDQLSFLAHMGDDRFMAIGPAGQLGDALARVVENFERQVPATPVFLGPVGQAPDDEDPQVMLRLGLRIILMPGIFARVSSIREIVNLERQVRQALHARYQGPASRSILVRDTDMQQPLERRRSA
ncbi:MAG: EAL domain-containing protein [bacterium]